MSGDKSKPRTMRYRVSCEVRDGASLRFAHGPWVEIETGADAGRLAHAILEIVAGHESITMDSPARHD